MELVFVIFFCIYCFAFICIGCDNWMVSINNKFKVKGVIIELYTFTGLPNNIRAPLIFEIQIWPQKWIQHTRNMSQTYSLYRRFPRLSTRKLKFSIFGGFSATLTFLYSNLTPKMNSAPSKTHIYTFSSPLYAYYTPYRLINIYYASWQNRDPGGGGGGLLFRRVKIPACKNIIYT